MLLIGRKEYGPAAFMLEGAVRLFPEQKTIDLLEEAKFQDLVTRAREAVERDPDTAEKLADQALRMRPTDISASNIIKQAKAKALGVTVAADASTDAIMKAVVDAKLGDKALWKN